MSIINKSPTQIYKDLLQMDNNNTGVTTSSVQVKDGEGTASALYLSDDEVKVAPVNDDTSSAFKVSTKSGTDVLTVDTTNQLVVASGNKINTQYSTFSIVNSESASFADDTHQAIPFNHANYGDSSNPPAFGTGTDPATTFTTAEGNGTRASDIIPCLWYVPDAITIDAVYSLEGADTATGDTTRMHLFSYNFSNGSTSMLSSGTLLAHNSDVTNAGSEQGYFSSWTVDSSAVAAGSIILAFFKSDSINSDYSLNITVKYHLT